MLEVSVATGQVIAAGTQLGTVELDDPSSKLKTLAYFAIKDGKRIRPGMAVHSMINEGGTNVSGAIC